jgi:hypothetical protein
MLPATRHRVALNTPKEVNDRIRRHTDMNVARYSRASAAAIDERLLELDHEWDVERALEASAAAFSLAGLGLGYSLDRRFYLLPALVAGFLLQHALQGWCPPVTVLRRLGYRTQAEIEQERYALKALRGDFGESTRSMAGTTIDRLGRVLEAIRR